VQNYKKYRIYGPLCAKKEFFIKKNIKKRLKIFFFQKKCLSLHYICNKRVIKEKIILKERFL